ncbi:MAG TPA: UbiA-like polyprenyltransferase [Gemmatimonadota bacterium]|nr:UbiA-like polyprenyltransferase [Gemmatimonadota bacterium]
MADPSPRAEDVRPLPPRAGGPDAGPAGRVRTWGRFLRFEHTLFSLPMLFAGVFLGAGLRPAPRLMLLVLVAGVGARTAAMGLNRVIDRRIDAENPRTATRELPSGALALGEAWALISVGALLYLTAAWLLAPVCLVLAPIPLAVFVLYPYLKRVTPWCHLGVGLALAMAPLGGWFAARLTFEDVGPALLLAGFTLGWVAGFDVLYATLDEAHDRSAGIRSLPARYGRGTALRASRALHLGAWALLATLVFWRLAWTVALLPLLAVGALLAWEQRRADDIDLAFFRINVWVGFAALATVVAGMWGESA